MNARQNGSDRFVRDLNEKQHVGSRDYCPLHKNKKTLPSIHSNPTVTLRLWQGLFRRVVLLGSALGLSWGRSGPVVSCHRWWMSVRSPAAVRPLGRPFQGRGRRILTGSSLDIGRTWSFLVPISNLKRRNVFSYTSQVFLTQSTPLNIRIRMRALWQFRRVNTSPRHFLSLFHDCPCLHQRQRLISIELHISPSPLCQRTRRWPATISLWNTQYFSCKNCCHGQSGSPYRFLSHFFLFVSLRVCFVSPTWPAPNSLFFFLASRDNGISFYSTMINWDRSVFAEYDSRMRNRWLYYCEAYPSRPIQHFTSSRI